MKNLKKVLALVLACVMVFGTVTMAAGTGYPDVADDAAYAEAVKTLSALNIIKGDENGNFNPDATITRSEMAKILCTMLNTGELAQRETSFNDVPSSHWASGYISYAQQLGCIDGYGDGNFGPEDPVTYVQVIKLVMATLGYTYMANENGGYPTGYLYVAANAEVTKGVSGSGDEPAARSLVAVIVNNAMNTPVMERTAYGTESVWQVLDGGIGSGNVVREFKTLLTKQKIYKVEGKVTDTYKNNTSMKDGLVNVTITKDLKIDVADRLDATGSGPWTKNNVNASLAGDDATDYIGYISSIYFKEADNGDIVIIRVAPKSSKNTSIVIDDIKNAFDTTIDAGVKAADQPQAAFASGTTTVASYQFPYWVDRDADSRISTLDIAADATVYWNNGVAAAISSFGTVTDGADTGSTAGDDVYEYADRVLSLIPERGSMTFVDTDNDGLYDLIKVKEYKIAVVDSVNAGSMRVNFKTERSAGVGSRISLTTDVNANLKEYSITLDGAAIDVADLAEYDVLSIATNNYSDPTFYEILVTRSVVEGTVSGRKDAAGTIDDYVIINGEKYGMAGIPGTTLPNLEDEGKFYLDAEGKIVMVDTTSTISGNYAYLYSTGEGTFAGENYVRMFTVDGADVTYRLADKVKINGVQSKGATVAYTLAEVGEIFGVSPAPTSTAAATVDDVFTVSGSVMSTSDPLTAGNFVKALTDGANKTARTGLALDGGYSITGNATLDKFVTYKVDGDNNITEISLAINGAALDQFGYITSDLNVEWQAALGKFKGGKSVSEKAPVFFLGGSSIADYSVKTVADLIDGNQYTPYYFTNTEEGPAAVVMLTASTSLAVNDSLAIFADSSSAKVDGNDVYNVVYWQNGAKVEETMVVKGDVTVAGIRGSFGALQMGDAFVFSKDDDGMVDKITVIFAPGDISSKPAISTGALTSFAGFIDITDGSVSSDFQALGGAGAQDNEVYFGVIGKTKSIEGGVRVTLFAEDGATSEVINVPESAKVTIYNAANTPAKMLNTEAAVVTDIQASFIDNWNADGSINWAAQTTVDDVHYMFVRVYKDVVTEVILVDYANL